MYKKLNKLVLSITDGAIDAPYLVLMAVIASLIFKFA